MTFLVFRALKRLELIFWELSKTVFGFFVAQIGPGLAGGGAERPPPAPPRQEVLENFRVKNRVKNFSLLESYINL